MGGIRRGGTLELPEERTVGLTVRLNPSEATKLDRLQGRLGARTRSDALRALLGGWLRSGERAVAVAARVREPGPRWSVRLAPGEQAQLAEAVAAAGSFAGLVRIVLAWAAGLKARDWREAFGG